MKLNATMGVAVACAFVLASGCSKKEEAQAPPEPMQSAGEMSTSAVQSAVATAQAQTDVVKEAVEETATNLQTQAAGAVSKVQGIIEQARKLIAENKMSDALALLNGLSGQPLSPDQQSLVESFKEQIQKATEAAVKAKASDEATKAVGGMLKPKN